MIRICLTASLSLVCSSASAADVDQAKKATFVEVLTRYGCQMHNFDPRPKLVEAILSSGLKRDDLPPVAAEMFEKGEAKREGDYFVLTTKEC